jgi:hypothetical protein
MKKRGVFSWIAGLSAIAVLMFLSRGYFYSAKTIHQILSENKNLKKAVENLTREDQVGYAKVISQQKQDGSLFTTIKFVETARDNPRQKIIEKQYTLEGDIIHFDALIVKFGGQMVADGKQKSMYLWRRVYSEKMKPEDGLLIEQPGTEPVRYKDILNLLSSRDKELFWSNIWALANDPERLSQYGITAVYGNAVYSKLRPGFVYIFKINAGGQVYPEVVPEM